MNFIDRFSESTQISNSVKICSVEAKLVHADGRTDRKTDMAKLMVDFRNFANAPPETRRRKHEYWL